MAVTDPQIAASALADLKAGRGTAVEISERYGIPYRTLMRLKARGAPPERRDHRRVPPPPPSGEPRVVVVTGNVLLEAKEGLEHGIRFLSRVARAVDVELDGVPDPALVRAVSDGVVKTLGTVVSTLESRLKADGGRDGDLATMNDQQLIAEAEKALRDRAAAEERTIN